MNTTENQLNVQSIVFVSNDPEVLVKGQLSKGHMSFDTELLITQTQLNKLVNALGKQNHDFSMDQLLHRENVDQNQTLFYADFGSIDDTIVDLPSILDMNTVKQIRA